MISFDIVLYAARQTPAGRLENQIAECVQALVVFAVPHAAKPVWAGGAVPPGAVAVLNVQNGQDKSWSKSCNRAAAGGKAPWVLFLDVSRKVDAGFCEAVERATEHHPGAAGFALRLLPEETGHHINPVTLEAYTLPPCALLVSRRDFEGAGGFDTHLPPAAAAHDLALRLRAGEKKLYHVPAAVVLQTDEAGPTGEERRQNYLDKAMGDLLLAYKYGEPAKARRHYRRVIAAPQHFENVRKLLLGQYVRHFAKLWPCRFWRLANSALAQKAAHLGSSAYILGLGPAHAVAALKKGPKISVVVRTHARPQTLHATLQSIAHQTYANYEVVVVEDGQPTAQAMIEQEFGHLPIVYISTGAPVGRSSAGNLGMQKASGEYVNLLDDDDCFYPDHLEQYAGVAAAHPDADILFGFSTAMMADVKSKDPYVLDVKKLEPARFDRLNVFTMSQNCQIPISAAVFKKSLFERCGGLDENLNAHEDWAMWLRFLAAAKRANPETADVPRATMLFYQPANPEAAKRRMQEYMQNDAALFGDESIRFSVSVADLRGYYDGVLADVRHVKNLGELDAFLARQANREKERP